MMKDLFDQRAVAGAMKLANSDFPALAAAIENAQGVAQQTAKTMDSGLGGAFRRLMSAIEAMKIAIGEGLVDMLASWSEQLTTSAQNAGQWITNHQGLLMIAAKLIVTIGLLGGAFLAVAVPIKMASVAAGVASAAFMAMTAPAAAATVAVNGLSAAMTFMAAHPVAIVVAGLAAVAAALYVTESRYQSMGSVMGNVRARADEMRSADQSLMKELQALADKQGLTSEEFDRAEKILDRLEGRYGDLGVTIDRTAGKILGAAEAQGLMNERMKGATIGQLKAEALDLQSQIDELNIERGGVQSESHGLRDAFEGLFDWRHISEGLFGTNYDKVLLDKIMATSAKRQALLARIEALEGGDADALTGDAGGGEPTPGDLGGVLPKGGSAEEAAAMNERMLDRIAEERIQRIENEQDRAVAAINKRYEAEREKAKELGADLSLVEQARKAALKTADENYQRRRQEEQQRKDEMKAAANQRLQDEIAAMEIDIATPEGRERKKEQLDLQEQIELRDASKTGLDPQLIGQKYDLERQQLEMESRAQAFQKIDPVASTLSAEAAFRMGLGGKRDTAAEKTAKATERTAQNTERQLDETKQLRQTLQGSGRMSR